MFPEVENMADADNVTPGRIADTVFGGEDKPKKNAGGGSKPDSFSWGE